MNKMVNGYTHRNFGLNAEILHSMKVD